MRLLFFLEELLLAFLQAETVHFLNKSEFLHSCAKTVHKTLAIFQHNVPTLPSIHQRLDAKFLQMDKHVKAGSMTRTFLRDLPQTEYCFDLQGRASAAGFPCDG